MSYKEPIIIKILRNKGYLKNYKRISNGYLLYVRNFNFDRVVNIKSFAGGLFADTRDSFITAYQIISNKEMNIELKEVYKKMKSLESILTYKGFLKNNPIFISRPILKKIHPNLTTNTLLVDKLNNDIELIGLIRKIKPSLVKIVLKSLYGSEPPQDDSEVIKMEREFLEDPSEITWIISLSFVNYRGWGYSQRILDTFRILDKIVIHLRNITFKFLPKNYNKHMQKSNKVTLYEKY